MENRVKFPACLATLLITCLPTALHAEWRQLAAGPMGRISYDTASVKVQDGKTQLQYRIDYRTLVLDPATQKTAGSATIRVAVDCRGKTVAFLSSETHAGAEGKGAVVDRTVAKAPTAEPVSEASSNHLLWNAACNAPKK
jgi:hypothetical protein